MSLDIITGAVYHDSVFGSDFTVRTIECSETADPPADPSEVYATLDYEVMDDEVVVSIEQLRSEDGIEVIDVPY
jgi:hypothetical protein